MKPPDTHIPEAHIDDARLLVLASLAAGPKHGYAIMKDVEDFAGRHLGPGTLYGAIADLEKAGLVKPQAREDRRTPYALTPAGETKLRAQIAALSHVVKLTNKRLGAAG